MGAFTFEWGGIIARIVYYDLNKTMSYSCERYTNITAWLKRNHVLFQFLKTTSGYAHVIIRTLEHYIF